MKISLNRLKQLIDLGKKTPQEISDLITAHTAEVEEILDKEKDFAHVVVGKVLSITPHTNSEKLMIAQVDTGKHGKRQILFGSSLDAVEGEQYAVAIPGAKLANGMEIEDREMAGEKSEGMICIGPELGMKYEGLLRFGDDVKPGKHLLETIPACGDFLIDIDNKSLTHRPDLMGHRGFARELSAILDQDVCFTEPEAMEAEDEKLAVSIKTEKCRRFMAVKMKNVSITPSPMQTQIYLENLGVRAISNLVDITNMMLLEYGQPMHVFDADKVEGNIVIRQAKQGEKILALDDEAYELTPEDTVIADDKKVLSIAGIMGGKESSVTSETKNIIFECANFDPVVVRKTSHRLGLRSESSMRYEKNLDPHMCEEVLPAAIASVLELCPEAEIVSEVADIFPIEIEAPVVRLTRHKLMQYAGALIDEVDVERILTRLGFDIESKDESGWDVGVPTYRATKDIALEEDLIEEVIRVWGFHNIPETLPSMETKAPARNYLRESEHGARDFWASRGYLEQFGYSFVNADDEKLTDTSEYRQILNPLSAEHKQLRRTLLSNMIRHLESELRTQKTMNLFELGKVYMPHVKDGGVDEILHLGMMRAEQGGKDDDLFFGLQEDVRRYMAHLGVGVEFSPCEGAPVYAHPYKCADIVVGADVLGKLFALHPQKNHIKQSAIVFAEMDFEHISKKADKEEAEYKPLCPYPAVYRDISIVVDERVLMKDLVDIMKEASGFVEKVELFDEYRDADKLGQGLKNLAFHISLRCETKTLEEQDITMAFNTIVASLKEKSKAKLRLDFDQEKSQNTN